MIFSSLSFLCLFLPIVILLYYLMPPVLRNGLLLVASLFFYAWGEPIYILIMIFSTAFDYINGRLLAYFQEKEKVDETGKYKSYGEIILWVSVLGNLGILGFFKYSSFLLENVNMLFGTGFYGLNLALPIGISFYTFQTMSYTIDVYRGQVEAQQNFIDFAMYVSLFPQLIAGPIVRYKEISHELHYRDITAEDRMKGIRRFTIGLGKKVLLANQIGSLWEIVHGMKDPSMGLAWLGALAFSLQIYFDFSGYSDMAIGLGRIFGFHFPENFIYPYEAESITDFWRRWHRTLGSWFREYLYIPLGGNRCGLKGQICNLFIVWTLTGLWHGAGWNYILWGWYYLILLILEKTIMKITSVKIKSHFYVILSVIIGWVIFACEDLTDLLLYLRRLFHLTNFWDDNLLFYLRNYGILLLIAIIGASHFPKKLARRSLECLDQKSGNQRISSLISLAFISILMILSFVFLIGDAYNPFLYFRF